MDRPRKVARSSYLARGNKPHITKNVFDTLQRLHKYMYLPPQNGTEMLTSKEEPVQVLKEFSFSRCIERTAVVPTMSEKRSTRENPACPIKDTLLFCAMTILDESGLQNASERDFRTKMLERIETSGDLRTVTNQKFTKIAIEECKSDILMNVPFNLLHVALFCAAYKKRVLFVFDAERTVAIEFKPLLNESNDTRFVIKYSAKRNQYILSNENICDAPKCGVLMHQYNKALQANGTYKVNELRDLAASLYDLQPNSVSVTDLMKDPLEVKGMPKNDVYFYINNLFKAMLTAV